MSIVEHVEDFGKLAELLPHLRKEYAAVAGRFRLLLTIVALIPPLLIPIEAIKWFSHKPGLVVLFWLVYVMIAIPMLLFTARWIENLRSFGTQRIHDEDILPIMLERIEHDAGKSQQMVFEELYVNDGSGIEWRTRKHIIYAENDIELNMDRGQKLFGNNNVPLQINTGIVLVFCLYIIIGAPFLANDVWLLMQQTLLFVLPLAIYWIQNNFRQHQLNFVVADELLRYINGEDSPEAQALKLAEEAEDSLQAQA